MYLFILKIWSPAVPLVYNIKPLFIGIFDLFSFIQLKMHIVFIIYDSEVFPVII